MVKMEDLVTMDCLEHPELLELQEEGVHLDNLGN